jgi:predicted Fe-Mo cluster-binding NifX family protein
VIPVEDKGGLAALLSRYFGRASYFPVINIDDDNQVWSQQTISNRSEHFGGRGHPPDYFMQLKPDALITY